MGLLLVALGYVLGYYVLGSGVVRHRPRPHRLGRLNLVALFQGDNIHPLPRQARQGEEGGFPRLYNIVEEMSIASGLQKMPDIYIIDDPARMPSPPGASRRMPQSPSPPD
jgi:heat shock protein HtpX